MDPNERKILITTSVAHFLAHFFILVFPALVMPISRDLSLSPDHVISLSFPMYLCYGLMAIPCGFLSDYFDPRFTMGAGMLFAGIGFIAAGLSQSMIYLTLFFCLVGIGCSAYHPSGMALVSKGIQQRGKALGINGLFGNFGIASAPLIAGILCYITGWHATVFVLGCTGIVAGLLFIIIPVSVSKGQDLQKGTQVEKQQAVTLFLLLCSAMLFSGLMYRGFTVILPTFLESRLLLVMTNLKDQFSHLFDITSMPDNVYTLISTLITSVVYVIGMGGQLLGGRVADRNDLRWAYFVFFCCAFPFLIMLGIVKNFFLVIPAGFFALFSLGIQPIENSLVATLTPPQWRSVSYGIKFTIVFGAGALSVKLISLVQGKYGLDYVILVLVAYLLMVLLLIILLLIFSRGISIRHRRT